jgi:hypothetical protein
LYTPLRNSINDQNIDDIAYDDSDKCELLNKYFSSISKLDEENVTLPQFDSKTNNIIHEIHITENEIIDVIQILDPNKATGPDKISYKMLKISPDKTAKPLLIIINKSLQQSKYPSNLRPLCQTLSKALEKSQKTKQLNSFFSREFWIELYSSNS